MYLHVLNTIQQHSEFLLNDVQAILNDINLSFVEAEDQFIAEWTRELSRKSSKDMSQIMSSPHTLSHSVHECLLFEKALIDQLDYDIATYGATSHVFLEDESVFQSWLNVELQCKSTV
jgi:hypothetical protein